MALVNRRKKSAPAKRRVRIELRGRADSKTPEHEIVRAFHDGQISEAEAIKKFAALRGINYETEPFPPGDVREILRLNYLRVRRKEGRDADDKGRPSGIARAMLTWHDVYEDPENPNDHRPQRVRLRWRRTLTVGRTTLVWRGLPPKVRTADSIRKWLYSGTLRKRLTVLGTMFRQAKRWGLVASNPVEGVKKPSEPKGRLVYFDEAGFAKFVGELAPEYQPIARLAVLLGGPRRGDLLGLRWDDVDFEQGLVWIGNPPSTDCSRRGLQGPRGEGGDLAAEREATALRREPPDGTPNPGRTKCVARNLSSTRARRVHDAQHLPRLLS